MENRKLNGPKAGGAARAISSRKEALERYYKCPNRCLQCGEVIQVREDKPIQEARNKSYCNHSCAAVHSNLVSPKRAKVLSRVKTCKLCTQELTVKQGSKQRICSSCKETTSIEHYTKDRIFQSRTTWQSARTAIRKHAAQVFKNTGKPLVCHVCSYSNYVEIAHIKSVSSFAKDTLITEINHESNLIALCPNHHWEYDHGLLDLT
jgi:hypothetical protein